jgi:hypothetical protein
MNVKLISKACSSQALTGSDLGSVGFSLLSRAPLFLPFLQIGRTLAVVPSFLQSSTVREAETYLEATGPRARFPESASLWEKS